MPPREWCMAKAHWRRSIGNCFASTVGWVGFGAPAFQAGASTLSLGSSPETRGGAVFLQHPARISSTS
jgi:hypothetical protein